MAKRRLCRDGFTTLLLMGDEKRMALYALGDLHLSFQVDKPMDAFGRVWKHHEEKIRKYANRIVKPEDTFVLTGIIPGEENCRNAEKTWHLLSACRAVKYCCGEIMICSGMQKRRNV